MSGPGAPLFPSLTPRPVDRLWFNLDTPCDDEAEISKLEEEHQKWKQSIAQKGQNIIPIGKSAVENFDEDEEEDEDDDGDDDEESDSNEDELDGDIIDDQASPDDAEMEGNDGESPSWGV